MDNKDNLGIIFHISPYIFCDPSLEASPRDDSNEGSQNVFSLRKPFYPPPPLPPAIVINCTILTDHVFIQRM